MSAPVRKFTFDVDMADQTSIRSVRKASRQEILLKAAREEGYKAGFKDGENSEQLKSKKALIVAVNNLINIANNMLAERNKIHKEILAQSIDLARVIGSKLASNLIAKQPEVELKTLISECLLSIDDVPHLVIRTHPDLTDICKEAANEIMQTSRFSGNLVVMGDPEILLGDGKIEWVDGGLVRDSESIMREIDNSIANYLSAHQLTDVRQKDQSDGNKNNSELEENKKENENG